MLAVAVYHFYHKFGASDCKDWTNDLMPNCSSLVDKDTLVPIARKMGVYFKRLHRLPVGNIFANHHTVDRGGCVVSLKGWLKPVEETE